MGQMIVELREGVHNRANIWRYVRRTLTVTAKSAPEFLLANSNLVPAAFGTVCLFEPFYGAAFVEEEEMGLLDGLLGGAVGAEMVTVVNGLIEKHGGVKGIVSEFQQNGFGPTIQSWVGNGENLPISPDQVKQALGSDTVQQFAAKLGIPPDQLAQKLSQFLPQAIDKMTPEGKVS
ncbi:MAG: YidB family protein [Rhodomicrobium sp.]